MTDAIFEAGFNSSGHFYATADRRLGMTAGAFRKGGAGTSIHFATGVCSLGPLLVAQSDLGICAILLGDDPETLLENLKAQFPKAILMRGDQAYESRSEEHTSELQSLMRISYAVFCLKKKTTKTIPK